MERLVLFHTTAPRVGSRRIQFAPATSTRSWCACALVVLLIALLGQAPLAAQDLSADDAALSLSAETESVEERLKRIDESADLDKDLKAKLVDLYKGALEQLQAAADWQKKGKDWQGQRDAAPKELQQQKDELQKPRVEPQPPDNATLAQLDQLLADAESNLKGALQKLADREAEPKRRRGELPGLVAAAQKRFKDVEQELSTISQPGDALDPAEARRVLLTAMKRAVQAELAAYDSERVWYETNAELFAVRQDAAAHAAAQAEDNAKFYRELVNNRRKEEAMKQAEEARRAAVAAMPELKTLADRNAELTQEQNGPDGFPAKIAVMSQDVDDLKQLLAALRMKFDRVARADRRRRHDRRRGPAAAKAASRPARPAHAIDNGYGIASPKRRTSEPSCSSWKTSGHELSDVEVQVRKVMGTIDPNLLPVSPRRDRDGLARVAQGAARIPAIANRRRLPLSRWARHQPDHHREESGRGNREVQGIHQRAYSVGSQYAGPGRNGFSSRLGRACSNYPIGPSFGRRCATWPARRRAEPHGIHGGLCVCRSRSSGPSGICGGEFMRLINRRRKVMQPISDRRCKSSL